ncbi:MAG: hypothetical protein F6K10_09405 [Moorea sp. SIO2B7]|nr:hypothetical protein [Moorena sp. SIO2B7]
MSGDRNLRWFDYLEKLIIPVALGVLAWSTDVAANKISSSQHELATAELDAQLIDLFGKYYFGELPGERNFAINVVVQNIKNPALRRTLAEVIKSDERQSDETRSEASSIAEEARRLMVNRYKIQIFYNDKKPEQMSEAYEIKSALVSQGVTSTIEVRQQRDTASSDQIRYFEQNERDVALALQDILNSSYSQRSFVLQPVVTPSPGSISIFLKSES